MYIAGLPALDGQTLMEGCIIGTVLGVGTEWGRPGREAKMQPPWAISESLRQI